MHFFGLQQGRFWNCFCGVSSFPSWSVSNFSSYRNCLLSNVLPYSSSLDRPLSLSPVFPRFTVDSRFYSYPWKICLCLKIFCTIYIPGTCRGHNRASRFWELWLQSAVSHHCGYYISNLHPLGKQPMILTSASSVKSPIDKILKGALRQRARAIVWGILFVWILSDIVTQHCLNSSFNYFHLVS